MNDVPLIETWDRLAQVLPPFLVLLTLVVLGRFEKRVLEPEAASDSTQKSH